VLARRHPGLVIAGHLEGDPAPTGEAAARAVLTAAGPIHLLLVAYGAPRQEAWLARNLPHLPGVAIGIGVGGTFNFIAGRSPRPPAWMQRVGLGWLFRLLSEPWRWRRQLALPHFAALVLLAAGRRRGRLMRPGQPESHP
jgi:N-acetylglucosaminyldiphosphoundecaprenol N-acetyl-beta-D-mannosaminyltransferase